MEITIPKFTQDNWSTWKEKFMSSLELIVGYRDDPITYVLTGVIDYDDLGRISSQKHVKLTTELIASTTTHYVNLFRSDNELVFTKLE